MNKNKGVKRYNAMNEKQLIQKSIDGDSEAFNQLVQPYLQVSYTTSYLILNDKQLAEDAIQESLYQTYISLKRFDEEKAQFKTWLNRIVINCSLKVKRKIKIFTEFQPSYMKMNEKSPEEIMVQNEKYEDLYKSIYKLSSKLKVVIILHYFQELSIQEISLTLEISEGTVKSRLHKARKKLEIILQDKNLLGGD